jgi:hypothetical protein
MMRRPDHATAGFSPDEEFLALASLVDTEPVEDGVRHSAEPKLADYIERHGVNTLVSQALGQALRASRAAAFLRLLGRIAAVDEESRKDLVERGLQSASVEVRDAAVQAAESWGSASLVPLLKAHHDPVPWLADYAERVARDLSA